jgi:hypothetical protein
MTKQNNLYLTKHIKGVVRRCECEDQEKKDTRRYLKAGVPQPSIELSDINLLAKLCLKGLGK